MQHVVWDYCGHLPFWLVRRVVFLLIYPLVAVAWLLWNDFGAIHVLAIPATFAVSDAAASSAACAISPLLLANMRPAMLACLQAHARRGDDLVVVTGNFSHLLAPFCARHLNAEVVGTEAAGGRVRGSPCVLGEKSRRVGADRMRAAVAYGNSENDIALLEAARVGVAVTPSRRLAAWAERQRARVVTHAELATGAVEPAG